METSPIDRIVIALESIAKSLESIEEALYADHDDPEYCRSMSNVLRDGFQGLGREISGK